jgi:hypothetical protein
MKPIPLLTLCLLRAYLSRFLPALLALTAFTLLPIPAAFASPVDAAQSKMDYTFQLTAHTDSTLEGAPICAGETVSIIVRAWMSGINEAMNERIPRQFAVGVPVDALVQNKNVASLTSNSRQLTSMDVDDPGAAVFTFKTKNPGQTKITFEAMFPERLIKKAERKDMSPDDLRQTLYAEVETSIWVIECPLEITVMNQYASNIPNFSQHFLSVADRVVLQPEGEDGNTYSYEGMETVVITQKIPDCKVTWQKTERLVKITAVREGKFFRIKVNRGTLGFAVTHECEEGTVTTDLNVPEAGEQTWRIPVKGGTFTQSKRFPAASFWYVLIAKERK